MDRAVWNWRPHGLTPAVCCWDGSPLLWRALCTLAGPPPSQSPRPIVGLGLAWGCSCTLESRNCGLNKPLQAESEGTGSHVDMS